jgi:hypothetical protein
MQITRDELARVISTAVHAPEFNGATCETCRNTADAVLWALEGELAVAQAAETLAEEGYSKTACVNLHCALDALDERRELRKAGPG